MENIHVSLRIRPLNDRELRAGEKSAWEVQEGNAIQVQNDNIINQTSRNVLQNALSNSRQLRFMYDRCFDELATNKTVYENSVQSILKSSLNGVNGTIFMYGQSGSGKTYTMMGYDKNQTQQQQQLNQARDYFNNSSGASTPQAQQQLQRKKSGSNLPSANCTVDIDDIDFDRINISTPDDNKGILMLALQDFFDTIKADEDKTYVVRCSYVEIYNDYIYDLLNSQNRLSEVLSVGLNQQKEFYIKGVTEESVSSLEEAFDVLKKGESNKHYAQTSLNHHSSRSHSIFKLYVQSISSSLLKTCMHRKSQSMQYGVNGVAPLNNINNIELINKLSQHDATLISTSELNFIDLAGSEKVSNHANLDEILSLEVRSQSTDTVKDRVKEGQFINKSLFFLTQVISQIAEGKSLVHIPYRNSPLTKILKSSLGGNARTMIILCITPAQSQFEQSYSTIRFGQNAKKIENKVRANIQAKNNEEALQLLILDYEKKIRDLEISRNEEKTRNQDLVKKLNDLSSQNAQIQQKLMAANRKNIELSLTKTRNLNGEGVCQNCQNNGNQQTSKNNNNETTNKLPSDIAAQKSANTINIAETISNLFKQEREGERSVVCSKVGVLMCTRKNNLTKKDVNHRVKDDWQELIFDYEGRYAFHQYQRRSRQFAAYLQLWNRVSQNIDDVLHRHLTLFDAAAHYQALLSSSNPSFNTNLQINPYANILSLGRDKERDQIRRMFYNHVDVSALLGKDIDMGDEPDFNHLKGIVNKSTYSHLNIFKDETIPLTPKLNKSSYREILSQHKQLLQEQQSKQNSLFQNNEIEDEILKREESRTELNNYNNNLGLYGQNSKTLQAGYNKNAYGNYPGNNNSCSNSNNNSISMNEEKLKYHQNPMPKDQENEIMENFEKLQQTQNNSHFMGLTSTLNTNNIASTSSANCYFSSNNNNNINKLNIYPPSSISSTVPISQFNNNNSNTSQLFDGYSTISNVPTPSNVSMNSNQIVNSLRFNNNNIAINNYNSNYSNSNYSGFASPANVTTCKEIILFNEPATQIIYSPQKHSQQQLYNQVPTQQPSTLGVASKTINFNVAYQQQQSLSSARQPQQNISHLSNITNIISNTNKQLNQYQQPDGFSKIENNNSNSNGLINDQKITNQRNSQDYNTYRTASKKDSQFGNNSNNKAKDKQSTTQITTASTGLSNSKNTGRSASRDKLTSKINSRTNSVSVSSSKEKLKNNSSSSRERVTMQSRETSNNSNKIQLKGRESSSQQSWNSNSNNSKELQSSSMSSSSNWKSRENILQKQPNNYRNLIAAISKDSTAQVNNNNSTYNSQQEPINSNYSTSAPTYNAGNHKSFQINNKISVDIIALNVAPSVPRHLKKQAESEKAIGNNNSSENRFDHRSNSKSTQRIDIPINSSLGIQHNKIVVSSAQTGNNSLSNSAKRNNQSSGNYSVLSQLHYMQEDSASMQQQNHIHQILQKQEFR